MSIHRNTGVRDTGDQRRSKGLFAIGPIRKGEIIDDTSDDSQILSIAEVMKLPEEFRGYYYGIDDERELCPKDFIFRNTPLLCRRDTA